MVSDLAALVVAPALAASVMMVAFGCFGHFVDFRAASRHGQFKVPMFGCFGHMK